jgi:NAD(P)-dependent dehydrogenase (short-subunit alcohol dehydrogenase family)
MAISGLDNVATAEVANTASKFGLRGAARALRMALRHYGIGITVINLGNIATGNIATEEVMADIKEGRFDAQIPISLEDIISAIEWILTLSNSADIGENQYVRICTKKSKENSNTSLHPLGFAMP